MLRHTYHFVVDFVEVYFANFVHHVLAFVDYKAESSVQTKHQSKPLDFLKILETPGKGLKKEELKFFNFAFRAWSSIKNLKLFAQ